MATWNGPGAGTFEGEPLGTTDAGTTDETFKALKQEVRERGAVEHDWSDATVSTNPKGTNDDGRHRLGSARAFFQTTAPTVLTVVDQLGSNTLDDGRLWVDSDDENILRVRDQGAAAWEAVGIVSLDNAGDVDLTTTAPTTGDQLQYNGSDWIPVSPEVQFVRVSAPQVFSRGAALAAVTDLTAAITVPATGRYYLRASVKLAGDTNSAIGAHMTVIARLMLDINGGGAKEVDRSGNATRDGSYNPYISLSLVDLVAPAVAGSVYTYTVEAQSVNTLSSGEHFEAQGASTTSTILLELVPYTNPV